MKHLQIKISPKNGGTEQAMKDLPWSKLELRNKLQKQGYALQEGRSTAEGVCHLL